VQLVSKISNLCDPDPPTLQTDRRTDRQTTCNLNTALCTSASRGNKLAQNLHNGTVVVKSMPDIIRLQWNVQTQQQIYQILFSQQNCKNYILVLSENIFSILC